MGQNVFGQELMTCSTDPMTGFYRDGCCETGPEDLGDHTVCAVLTEEFLDYSKRMGNDLTTPRPEAGFPGLKAGERWCICAERWKEAYDAGVAPKVVLEATNEEILDSIPLDTLVKYAYKEGSEV